MKRLSYLKTTVLTVVCLTFLAWSFAFAADRPDKKKQQRGKQSLSKGAVDVSHGVLNINNLTTWTRHDGESNHSPGGDNGMYYPKGTGNVIYQDGIYHGGKVYVGNFPESGGTPASVHVVRAGGSGYDPGTRQGWVTGLGATAQQANPGDARARAYRIRRDYASMTTEEARVDAQSVNELASTREVTDAHIDQVLANYDQDWAEWPVDLGAPFIERNGTPGYQAPPPFSSTFTVDDLIAGSYDEPGVAGSDPNSPADQVIWTVYNDLDVSQTLDFMTVEPMGVEVQKTVWGYKRTDALGNLYFARYRYINKGGVDIGGGNKGAFYIDSMYVCQWSDPDLGSFSDDLVGCDTTRSIGYVYNANAADATFQKYGIAPPAAGYDFLAGPLVVAPGDSAVFDLKRRYGYKNLGMSSFAYFSAGSPYSDPPGTPYEESVGQWWKMLRGFAPLGTISDADQPYANGPHPVSKFPMSGDPVAGTGFLDGQGTLYSFAPGDRRILLNTGPFRMAPGDTQDIVVGTVAGLGADRISSVAVMKANDNAVQETFDLLFQVARPPKNPNVKVSELDGEVILEWGSDQTTIKDTEGRIVTPGNYTFEGYNVYQFPSSGSNLSQGKRLATYDVANGLTTVADNVFDLVVGQFILKPVQFGNDAGVTRYYRLTRDNVRDIDKIYNGQEYYVAVTAYSVATLPGYTAALESSPSIITVRPKVPFGKVLNSHFGDSLAVTKTGASDGKVVVQVIDPALVSGDAYRVNFAADATWSVTNTTKGTTVVTGIANQTGDEAYPTVEGAIVKVFGAPNDSKDFLHTAGPTGAINPPSYAAFTSFNSWGFPNASGSADASGGGPSTGDWGGGRWGVNQGGSATGAYSTFVSRVFRNDNFTRFVPYDFEIRFTAAGGKSYAAFTTGTIIDVPFELWNIGINTPNDPSDDYRMIPWILDEDGNEQFNLTQFDHALSGGDNDPYTDWIYWRNPVDKSPGQNGYQTEFVALGATYDTDPSSGANTGAHAEVMARMVLCNVNGGSVSDPTWPANATSVMPATGNVIRIVSTKPNSPAVSYTYSTAGKQATTGADVEKLSAEKVGVFPNPYYAFNAAETNRFFKFVTFNNLPRKATFRIFNLAGQLVRTIDKDDASQYLRWDLNNQSLFPVASGIYIVHIEMPDVGVTKILKVAIIQEQEVLDSY